MVSACVGCRLVVVLAGCVLVAPVLSLSKELSTEALLQ